jgi:hypothetical protein
MSTTTVRQKCSRQLLNRMQGAQKGDPLQVIVRVTDSAALARLERLATQAPDLLVDAENEHAAAALENVAQFLRTLEREGAPVRILDTSWLTHSILAMATPKIVHLIAQREDVDSIDLNAEVGRA